jgi:hypothetical protein
MLAMGFIRPSSSPYSAPLLIVPKKDNTWLTVLDYRRLNLVTCMNRHPLPLIQYIFDQLAGATVFTTLDLKKGYHQLPVHPTSIEKNTGFFVPCWPLQVDPYAHGRHLWTPRVPKGNVKSHGWISWPLLFSLPQ